MATWTAPTTRSSGDLITASIWNTDLVENLKYLKDAPVIDTAVIIGAATTSGIRLDLESGALAVREGDDSAYGPIIAGVVNLPSTGSINFASSDVTITHSTNTLAFAGASTGYTFADGPVTVALGAVGTPSLTFSGDLNTGLWSPTADTLAASTGGTERLRITSTGNVHPGANDGGSLGISGTAWADLFLASGGVINFNAGDVTITHSADALTIGGGNLGIGVTPTYKLQVDIGSTSGAKLFKFTGASTQSMFGYVDAAGVGITRTDPFNSMVYLSTSNTVEFYTASTERARFNSGGDLLIGTTTVGGDGITLAVRTSGGGPTSQINFNRADSASSGDAVAFSNNGTRVGTISYTNTTTTYSTSSDYRLKNINGPVTDSGAYIDALKPVCGTWKIDGSPFVGLIAHEVQAVSRTSVATGVKDGPEIQAMDYSSAEIIANLIAEVQSLRLRVATLEA